VGFGSLTNLVKEFPLIKEDLWLADKTEVTRRHVC